MSEPARENQIDRLIAIMARLRDPQRGCEWDLAQDFASIAPYTIEEAYEVADAIERDAMTELREELGEGFLIVVPGIRPVANVDDQKRTVDVEDAFLNGADYIVVGRPIRNAPDPAKAAGEIQARIRALFDA